MRRMKLVLLIAGLSLFGLIGVASANVDATASAACVKCHDEEERPDWSRTAHAAVADARTPTCVTCHGPSPTHVNKPAGAKQRPSPDRLFGKGANLTSIEQSEVCLGCHEKDAKRALWAGSQHETGNVACNSCHKIHTNDDKVRAKATQVQFCETCHKEQRAQLSRPSHHPLPEGKMVCSDCHNVHGSAGPKLAKRDNINDTCYTCHAEKRGPFVHAHEPVTDDCSNCHNPHGSTVASMLKARAPILCQQCHTPHVAGAIGAVGGQAGVFGPAAPGQFEPSVTGTTSGKNVVNLWQGRSCLNCHTQIHGSNNPSTTNPTPQFLFR